MVSATDGWLVGDVETPPTVATTALLAHFDGTAWRYSADSANFPAIYPDSVSMVSADDGWAVGAKQDGTTGGVLLHYTGGHWHEVSIAASDFPGGYIHMISDDDGWLYYTTGK
jgi:hypothetical protein